MIHTNCNHKQHIRCAWMSFHSKDQGMDPMPRYQHLESI